MQVFLHYLGTLFCFRDNKDTGIMLAHFCWGLDARYKYVVVIWSLLLVHRAGVGFLGLNQV